MSWPRQIVFQSALTPDEIAAVVDLAFAQPLSVDDQAPRGPEFRCAQARRITHDGRSGSIYNLIERLFVAANDYFHYEIDGIQEPILHATYPVGGHFSWHTDTGPGRMATRKLSVSIMLSSSVAFDGGDLEFCPGGRLTDDLSPGTAIVFPSYMAHRVTPVTRGQRTALVGWVHGREFS